MEAREVGHSFGVPITSCAHSQMFIATMLGSKFSIIDISENHNLRMRDLVIQYGFSNQCASVRNINFPLPRPPYDEEYRLEIEKNKALSGEVAEIVEVSVKHCIESIEEDGAETLILGCSALYWMRPILQRRLYELGWHVPVLEGYRCALEHLKLLTNISSSASGLLFPIDRAANWRKKKLL